MMPAFYGVHGAYTHWQLLLPEGIRVVAATLPHFHHYMCVIPLFRQYHHVVVLLGISLGSKVVLGDLNVGGKIACNTNRFLEIVHFIGQTKICYVLFIVITFIHSNIESSSTQHRKIICSLSLLVKLMGQHDFIQPPHEWTSSSQLFPIS